MAQRNFANLTYSENDRCLIGPSGTVSLRPKVGAVLEILLNNKKKVIDKEVFFKRCWPEIHVEERALSQVFSELRQAFERVGGDRNLLESIAKKGYRLNVEPTKTDPMNMELVHKPQIHEPKRGKKRNKVAFWLIPILGIFVFTIILKFDRHQILPAPTSLAFLPFKNVDSESHWNWLELALPDLLSQTSGETMQVIPFQDVYKELNRLDCDPSDAFNHEVLVKSLGNPRFIFASYSTRGERVVFEFRISGPKENKFQITTENPADSLQAIAKRISKELGQVPIDVPFSADFLNENYAKGLNYFLNDDHEKALPYLEVCFGEEPSHPSVGVMLARCYILKNQFNQAEYLLNAGSGWKSAEVAMLRAEMAFQTRDFPKSVQHAEVVTMDQDADELLKARAYSLLGTTLVRTGQASQGFESYVKAEQIYLEKKNFKGFVAVSLNRLRAEQYSGMDVPDSAWLSLIEKSQIVENRFIEAHALYGLGDTHFYRTEFDKAIQRFGQSLDIRLALADERGIGACHAALGSCFLLKREFLKADKHLQKALEINLKNQDSYNAVNQYLELAKVNIGQKKYAIANEQYDAVYQLSIDHDDPEGAYRANYGKVLILLLEGKTELAHQKVSEIVNIELSKREEADLTMLQATFAYLEKDAGKAVLLSMQAKELIPPNDWNPIKQAYLTSFQKAVLDGNFQHLPYTLDPLHTPDF